MLILVDSNYLCWRAYHSRGHLQHDEVPTGVAFGFFTDILQLRERFNTDNFVFCFDSKKNKRKDLLVSYKSKRTSDPEARRAVRQQAKALREDYLPQIGFRNILVQSGYEADDLIAALAERERRKMLVVSSDGDLFQVLNRRTAYFNISKGTLITKKRFEEKRGIDPAQWADVKAIAGCRSDDVPGIDGVGEKTAVRFLRGDLKKGKKFEAIVKGNKTWRRNLKLVSLPLKGCDPPAIVGDAINIGAWGALLKSLGMRSLQRRLR